MRTRDFHGFSSFAFRQDTFFSKPQLHGLGVINLPYAVLPRDIAIRPSIGYTTVREYSLASHSIEKSGLQCMFERKRYTRVSPSILSFIHSTMRVWGDKFISPSQSTSINIGSNPSITSTSTTGPRTHLDTGVTIESTIQHTIE